MSRTFWTSDLHVGHRRIVQLSCRPFADLAEMEETIAARWAAIVGADDIVWVLGDLTIDSQWRRGLEIVAGLPGRKRIVTGNHDAAWAGKRDFHRVTAEYLKVFEVVSPFARTRVRGRPVMMSHFPYQGDHSPVDRYVEYRLGDNLVPLLCGHVHQAWKTRRSRRGTPMLNVGVDQWDSTPVSDSQVGAWIAGHAPNEAAVGV